MLENRRNRTQTVFHEFGTARCGEEVQGGSQKLPPTALVGGQVARPPLSTLCVSVRSTLKVLVHIEFAITDTCPDGLQSIYGIKRKARYNHLMAVFLQLNETMVIRTRCVLNQKGILGVLMILNTVLSLTKGETKLTQQYFHIQLLRKFEADCKLRGSTSRALKIEP